jgi:hypothetical protein
MGIPSVEGSGSGRNEGVSMLDEGAAPDAGDVDSVQFSRAGAQAAGMFRCIACGYGVTVQMHLPRCPMCGGKDWEAAPAPRLSLARPLM